MSSTQATEQMSDAERTTRIRNVVSAAGADLRQRHPWLRHQDAIGFGIFIASIAGMIASGWLWYVGVLPFWLSIPLTAVFAAFIHELEHDLIHDLYFKKNRIVHHLMLALGWVARPSTINPWIRRGLHLHHHRHSGTESDIEERAITNGDKWGLARFIMTGDSVLAILLRLPHEPSNRVRVEMVIRALVAYFPLGWAFWGSWYLLLGFHGANAVAGLTGNTIAWADSTLALMEVMNVAAVVLIIPNIIRGFCLHFVSSNMHYYGDVEDRNIMQQCQVLNPWWLTPLQLFCFNFGSTHAIHHFVVREPFYVRQWTATAAHDVMREMGVRFNDLGTFRRANRLHEVHAEPAGV